MKTLIIRDCQEHLKSMQFIVLIVISMALFALNGVMFADRINYQISDYATQTASNYPWPSTIQTGPKKEPRMFLFIAEGGDRYLPAGYWVSPGGRLRPEVMKDKNEKMPPTPEMDWAFIIKTVFSLYVILIGYRAIAGERASGTLMLVLSHPLSRLQFLMAKYLSTMIIVSVPLIIGIIVSLIILSLSLPMMTGDLVPVVIASLLIMLMFLSLFTFLTLTISALIRNQTVVLLTLLVIWVGMTLMVSSSTTLAKIFTRAPREYELARLYNMNPDTRELDTRVARGDFHSVDEVRAAGEKMLTDASHNLSKITEKNNQSKLMTLSLARSFSRISPLGLVQYALEGAAGTGYRHEARVIDSIQSFSIIYDRYVLNKVGAIVKSGGHTFYSLVDFNGERIEYSTARPVEYDGDKSDFPTYHEQKRNVSGMIQDSAFDTFGLIIWNLICAITALMAFSRSDVRYL